MKKFYAVSILFITTMWVLHTWSKNFIVDPNFTTFLAKKDQILANESLWVIMIQIHIILATISLLTGPLGIIKPIRKRSRRFHRWNGRLYVLSIVLNFIPGIYVSFFASGGWPSTIGFLVLNILWFGTTFLGYLSIKKKNVILHSQWMTRSFFLCFANMTIYVIVAITHSAMNLSYGISYTIAVWLCWMLNLGIAEFVIRKKVFL